MSMKTMYWVSQIFSWNYIDIAGKTHGRIDWFENIRDMGYWWQTAYETGIASSVEQAKRGVEDAVMRRRMALEARYLASLAAGQAHGAVPREDGPWIEGGELPAGVAWPA